MLGGLAFFRNQDPSSSLVPLNADILVVDERGRFFLEAVSVPLGVIDELLRQENVSWFSEGLDTRSDDNDVGNFRVLHTLQSGVEFPEAAMGANSDLQVVSGG